VLAVQHPPETAPDPPVGHATMDDPAEHALHPGTNLVICGILTAESALDCQLGNWIVIAP
jgi:hypothetical protein